MPFVVEFNTDYFIKRNKTSPEAEYVSYLEKRFLLPLGLGIYSSANTEKMPAFIETEEGQFAKLISKKINPKEIEELVTNQSADREVDVFENKDIVLCDAVSIRNIDVFTISMKGKTDDGLKKIARLLYQSVGDPAIARNSEYPILIPYKFDDWGKIQSPIY